MRIRPVTDQDFEAIAALTTHYILRTAIHFGARPVTGDELREDWHKTREKYAFGVAVTDGDEAIAGFARAMVFRTRAAYAWTAEVGVYVDERHQRTGVATALYRTLFSVCRDQGYHSLIAGIALPNEPSVALHERLGFAPVGVFKELGWKHDGYHDVGFWQLMLSPAPSPAQPLRAVSEVWR